MIKQLTRAEQRRRVSRREWVQLNKVSWQHRKSLHSSRVLPSEASADRKKKKRQSEHIREIRRIWELFCCCCSNPRFRLVSERFTAGRKERCGQWDEPTSLRYELQQLFQVCTVIELGGEKKPYRGEAAKERPLWWEQLAHLDSSRAEMSSGGEKPLQPRARCHMWGSYRLLSVYLTLCLTPSHTHTHTHTRAHTHTHTHTHT